MTRLWLTLAYVAVGVLGYIAGLLTAGAVGA